MNAIYLSCSILTILFLSSCGTNTNQQDCPIGQPTAMFSKDLAGITNYSFTVDNQQSLESFLLKNKSISIDQGGCDLISQTFNFKSDSGKNSEEVIDFVSRNLIDFSQLGDTQGGFLAWSQAIEEIKPSIKIGQPFSPAPGIQIIIDRIQQNDHDLIFLKLEMSQN